MGFASFIAGLGHHDAATKVGQTTVIDAASDEVVAGRRKLRVLRFRNLEPGRCGHRGAAPVGRARSAVDDRKAVAEGRVLHALRR